MVSSNVEEADMQSLHVKSRTNLNGEKVQGDYVVHTDCCEISLHKSD